MKAVNKERDKIIIKKYIEGETTTSLGKEFGITSTRRYNIEQPRVEVEIENL